MVVDFIVNAYCVSVCVCVCVCVMWMGRDVMLLSQSSFHL